MVISSNAPGFALKNYFCQCLEDHNGDRDQTQVRRMQYKYFITPIPEILFFKKIFIWKPCTQPSPLREKAIHSRLLHGVVSGENIQPRKRRTVHLNRVFFISPALEMVTGECPLRPHPSSRPSSLHFNPQPVTMLKKPGAATSTSSCVTLMAPVLFIHFMCSPPCLRYDVC